MRWFFRAPKTNVKTDGIQWIRNYSQKHAQKFCLSQASLVSGWVVTCCCFLFSYLYPESYTPFSSPHFWDQTLLKHLTLSTKSVTKKIIVVRIVFYNSDSIFATKNFVTESVLKVRSFMRISWHCYIGVIVDWKMVYNFLHKDEKTQRYLYLLLLKTSLWERS